MTFSPPSLFKMPLGGTGPMPVIMIIPSGIGCSIGGFAGDAIPSARLLASACGCLITHPNVMNAASLYWNDSRIHYVEGYSLNRFSDGCLGLQVVRQQKVGILFDSAIDVELRQRHLQVADACMASLGLNIGPVEITDEDLDIRINSGTSGASWGEIGRPEELIRSGERLKYSGATAIAVVTKFPDDLFGSQESTYRHGEGVDLLAGAEAVISHLLVKQLSIPCAHAPALGPIPLDFSLDPRVAAEEIGYTFLPSVLVGLSRAPDLIAMQKGAGAVKRHSLDMILIEDVGAIVVPQGALGGETTLSCIEKRVPIIAVENPNVLNVSSKCLELMSTLDELDSSLFYPVRNYIEAAGLLLLLREGLNIESFKRPLKRTF